MEIKKNECYEISIVDMAEDGQGIGKIGDFVVFVKDTVIGDVAKVKLVKVLKHYGFGRLEELLMPSKDRVEPLCAHAKACGGCTLQHLSYEKQLQHSALQRTRRDEGGYGESSQADRRAWLYRRRICGLF